MATLNQSRSTERHDMNIASPKVDELAQRLARLTGEDVETALERAIEERLSRVAGRPPR